MYAIVRDRGKQYKVQEGELLQIDLVPGQAGAPYVFETVLCCSDGKSVQVGTPVIPGAAVEALIEENPVRTKKVRTLKKFKNETKLHKGHRQRYTLLRVRKIKAGA